MDFVPRQGKQGSEGHAGPPTPMEYEQQGDTGAGMAMDSAKMCGSSSKCVTDKKIIELYDLKEELGRGAFSVVYKAQCRESGELVAIKIVSYHIFKPGDKERQLRILDNEVMVMEKIALECANNPNIIKLIRYIKEPKRMGIVMELLQGRELFDRIVERKKYTEQDAASLIVKIMRAVKALHDIKVVHRDLKPENLVFESEGDEAEVKITDFGLSYVQGWPDVHQSVVGTPNYVAPEVVSLRPRGPFYGPHCDVWSMGVILYILLVGYPPFYHEEPKELFKQIRSGSYQFHPSAWKNISREGKDLVAKMLMVNRHERISVDGVLQHPWVLSQASQEPLDDTLQRLRSLNAKRRFKAAAMAVVWGAQLGLRRKLISLVDNNSANVFNLEELSRIRDTFYRHAVDGKMDIPAFRDTLRELGFSDLPVERLFAKFDENNDGVLDYKEVLCNLATLKSSNEDSLKLIFNVYDEHQLGYLRKNDVASVLRIIFKDIADSDIAAMVTEIFDSIDSDRMMYEEFKNLIFTKTPILVEHFLKPMDNLVISLDDDEYSSS